MNNIRGSHVSPGIYMKEIDVTYAPKSMGITTLGLAGETLKGPAFQPVSISDWDEFKEYFGGTSAEKVSDKDGNKVAKYELPYIAKEYLKESKQLEVTRVLGLSGYNAGPAWVLSIGKTGEKPMVFGLLRSKATIKEMGTDLCASEEEKAGMDCANFIVKDIVKKPINGIIYKTNCADGTLETEEGEVDPRRFKLSVLFNNEDLNEKEYVVSLIPSDPEYILKVFGTTATKGTSEIFVEEYYERTFEDEWDALNGEDIEIKLTSFPSIAAKDFKGLVRSEDIDKKFDKTEVGNLYLSENDDRIFEVVSKELQETTTKYLLGLSASDNPKNKDVISVAGKLYSFEKEWKESNIVTNRDFNGVLSNEERNTHSFTDKDKAGQLYLDANSTAYYKVISNAEGKLAFVGEPEGYLKETDIVSIAQGYKIFVKGGKTPFWKDLNAKEFADFYKPELDEKEFTSEDDGKLFIEKKSLKAFKVAGLEVHNVEYRLQELDEKAEKLNEQNVNGVFYKYDEMSQTWIEDPNFLSDKMENYKVGFQWATTPWFVSNARGNGKNLDVRRLFRLMTISDGNAANTHIKVSITNIDPSEGTFDIVIRDFFDTDANPVILERFAGCTMDPMSPNYIGLRIGTNDGTYEIRSKYVIAEVIDDEELYTSVPSGFLGYPLRNYGGNFKRSEFSYNLIVRPELKAKRQYFGVSDVNGEIDADAFQYKGEENNADNGAVLAPGFHLDERLSLSDTGYIVTVDGVAVSKDGIIPPFKTPSSIGTKYTKPGIIFTKESMKETIYEDKAMRKFTVCPFGGFDGWDIYREHRTNSDEYRFDRYIGSFYANGLPNNVFYPNPSRANKSDYYAFLCGYYTFSNPEEVDINLFATPGIDWKHNTELVKDTIDMIEDFEEGRGGDAFYTINSPESVEGAENAADTADSLVEQLEMTGIDTSYAGTFWPWIKYYDASERTYVDLPVTKDLVRNFAYIDNNLYPWFAPAGKTERGNVDCVRATYATRINEEDILYKGLINPVKTFAVDGVKIWGNKTLYSVDSPLNRINVRRLMIRIKKLISRACSTLIFEPNDMKVRNQFLSIVSPILEDVRSNRGITDFKIEVDNSVEAIDEHVLPAKIWIKPTPTLEYIELTFVITPQGASFTE